MGLLQVLLVLGGVDGLSAPGSRIAGIGFLGLLAIVLLLWGYVASLVHCNNGILGSVRFQYLGTVLRPIKGPLL
jgi:hypothetical protein